MYNYNDWISGKLIIAWNSTIPFFKIVEDGVKKWCDPNLVEEQELKKIKELQELVYDEWVHETINFLVEGFNIAYKNSPEPVYFCEKEIRDIKAILEKDEHNLLLEDILTGFKDLSISAELCLKIKSNIDEGWGIRHIPINRSALFTAYLKYMNYIKEYRSSKTIQYNPDKDIHKGFICLLKSLQIHNLYKQMMGVYIDANFDNWKAIFKNEPLPDDFIKVKWIFLNRKSQPHKTALREFLTLIAGKSPDQKTTNNCISDRDGRPIVLPKHKKEPNTEFWTDRFRAMIT